MTIALWWAVAITCAIAIVALFGMSRFYNHARNLRDMLAVYRKALGAEAQRGIKIEHDLESVTLELANAQREARILRREVDDMLQNVSWEGVLPVDCFKQRLSAATFTRAVPHNAELFPAEVGVWEIRMEPLAFRTAHSRVDVGQSEHVRKSIAMHMAAEFTEHLREDLAKRLEAQLKEDHEWLKANPPAADTTSTLRLTAS